MIYLACVILASIHQAKPAPQPFTQAHEVSYIRTALIDDASGLGASRIYKDILYTINDHSSSKPENRIFAINASTGDLVATLNLEGVMNNDWEDIAVGPCGKATCIYIGDTGDGPGEHPRNHIYRLKEPAHLESQTIRVHDILRFSWSEPESECIMVDDAGDVYVVSRVKGGHGLIARLPIGGWNSQETVPMATARISISTAHNDPRGCDISRDGKEMLIKAEDDIYYWRVTNRDYINTSTQPGQKVPYLKEPFGQSVAWAADGSGYYTLSEGVHESLYFYGRSQSVIG